MPQTTHSWRSLGAPDESLSPPASPSAASAAACDEDTLAVSDASTEAGARSARALSAFWASPAAPPPAQMCATGFKQSTQMLPHGAHLEISWEWSQHFRQNEHKGVDICLIKLHLSRLYADLKTCGVSSTHCNHAAYHPEDSTSHLGHQLDLKR